MKPLILLGLALSFTGLIAAETTTSTITPANTTTSTKDVSLFQKLVDSPFNLALIPVAAPITDPNHKYSKRYNGVATTNLIDFGYNFGEYGSLKMRNVIDYVKAGKADGQLSYNRMELNYSKQLGTEKYSGANITFLNRVLYYTDFDTRQAINYYGYIRPGVRLSKSINKINLSATTNLAVKSLRDWSQSTSRAYVWVPLSLGLSITDKFSISIDPEYNQSWSTSSFTPNQNYVTWSFNTNYDVASNMSLFATADFGTLMEESDGRLFSKMDKDKLTYSVGAYISVF